jgi:hypothetical protein
MEDTFAKLVGRQASEAERTRLYRPRDVSGVRDNDAFWSIVMPLEYYGAFFRQCWRRSLTNAVPRSSGTRALSTRGDGGNPEFSPIADRAVRGRIPAHSLDRFHRKSAGVAGPPGQRTHHPRTPPLAEPLVRHVVLTYLMC